MAWSRKQDIVSSKAMAQVEYGSDLNSQNIQYTTFNSPRLSDVYMHPWTNPSLVQIMACHLLGTMPLSEPNVADCE